MEWRLDGLRRCADLNGRLVTLPSFSVREKDDRVVVHLQNTGRTLVVSPDNVRSCTDDSVSLTTMLAAIAHLKKSPDERMRSVAQSAQKGRYDDAMRAALQWTRNQNNL